MEIESFVCDECEQENTQAEVFEDGMVNQRKDKFFAECQFCGHIQDITREMEKKENLGGEKWDDWNEDDERNEED